MAEETEVVAQITVGSKPKNAKAYGRYKFAVMPRIGETILIDLEQGEGLKGSLSLLVRGVDHIPVSLEAPMGPIPSVENPYVMIFCSEN